MADLVKRNNLGKGGSNGLAESQIQANRLSEYEAKYANERDAVILKYIEDLEKEILSLKQGFKGQALTNSEISNMVAKIMLLKPKYIGILAAYRDLLTDDEARNVCICNKSCAFLLQELLDELIRYSTKDGCCDMLIKEYNKLPWQFDKFMFSFDHGRVNIWDLSQDINDYEDIVYYVGKYDRDKNSFDLYEDKESDTEARKKMSSKCSSDLNDEDKVKISAVFERIMGTIYREIVNGKLFCKAERNYKNAEWLPFERKTFSDTDSRSWCQGLLYHIYMGDSKALTLNEGRYGLPRLTNDVNQQTVVEKRLEELNELMNIDHTRDTAKRTPKTEVLDGTTNTPKINGGNSGSSNKPGTGKKVKVTVRRIGPTQSGTAEDGR